jgi:hypothetical protein
MTTDTIRLIFHRLVAGYRGLGIEPRRAQVCRCLSALSSVSYRTVSRACRDEEM